MRKPDYLNTRAAESAAAAGGTTLRCADVASFG